MPFVLSPYRRFPIVSPATYEYGFREGQVIVWNFADGDSRKEIMCVLTERRGTVLVESGLEAGWQTQNQRRCVRS
jgi:hypothetical protein